MIHIIMFLFLFYLLVGIIQIIINLLNTLQQNFTEHYHYYN
jgi:hypothetical protein